MQVKAVITGYQFSSMVVSVLYIISSCELLLMLFDTFFFLIVFFVLDAFFFFYIGKQIRVEVGLKNMYYLYQCPCANSHVT